jgi:formimidoylglutamate deiminase
MIGITFVSQGKLMAKLYAERALLPDGWRADVRIEIGADGRIRTVEPDAAPQPDDRRLGGRILLPAPANLHSHSFQRAMAGLTEAQGADGRDSFWTWRTLMYRFLDRLDPDQIEAIAAQAFVEMLEAGYAAVGEFHYVHHAPGGGSYANPAETSLRIIQAAAATGIGLTHLPVLYAAGGADGRPLAGGQRRFGCDLERFLRLVEAARAGLAGLPDDARLGIAPHSLRAVPPALLSAALATFPDGPVHLHIAEQTREVEEIEAAWGARPVAWLLDHQPVDERWCLIHATHMTAAETDGVARSGAVAGLCPVTEANLGDGIMPAAAYLAAGGAFGVGTDSNIRIALAEELRQLEYSQRLAERGRAVLCRPGGSTGRTLYEAALAGGARALDRPSGAIAPGLLADLVTLDADALCLLGGMGDGLLDGWIFAGDDRAVREVWAAGRLVVEDGRHHARAAIEARYRRTVRALLDQA